MMYMIDCGNCLQIFPLGFAHFVVHIFISLIHVIIHRLKPLKNPFLKSISRRLIAGLFTSCG